MTMSAPALSGGSESKYQLRTRKRIENKTEGITTTFETPGV